MNHSHSPRCTPAILNSYGDNWSGTLNSRFLPQSKNSQADTHSWEFKALLTFSWRQCDVYNYWMSVKLTLDFLNLATERASSPITLPYDGSGLRKAVIINIPESRPHSPITTVPQNTSPFLQASDWTLITLILQHSDIHPSAKLCWGKHVFKMKSALLDIEARWLVSDIVGISWEQNVNI